MRYAVVTGRKSGMVLSVSMMLICKRYYVFAR